MKPKVLISIDWYQPGYKAGGPIQSIANLVAHLKKDVDFWIITRNTDYNSVQAYAEVPANEWHQLEEGVNVYYFSARHLTYASLKQVISDVPVDFVYINGIFSKFFSLMPLLIAKKNKNVPVVVASRGMFAPGAVQVKPGKKKAFFGLAKMTGLYKKVTFHATNEVEQEHIRAVLGHSIRVVIAPNLPKVIDTTPILSPDQKRKGELKLVSIARISPEKNTLYAVEVLKNHRFTGKVKFDIYGPINDVAYWEECEKLIKQLPSNINVQYKDSLPSHLVPETLTRYQALFLPTRGENFGHIILESLSSSLPVIISDQTPWNNLRGLQAGFDLSLAEPKQFAVAIQELLDMEQDEYRLLTQHAAKFAASFRQNEALIAASKALFAC